ncbi:MAG: hypothetical protein Kow0069_24490 [Promethearchaeota archaeon]
MTTMYSEDALYDEILEFYHSERDPDATDAWKGRNLAKLMQVYGRDPEVLRDAVRNSLILILNLFEEHGLYLPGKPLSDLDSDELQKALDDLSSLLE